MVRLQNPEIQSSEIPASTSEPVTWMKWTWYLNKIAHFNCSINTTLKIGITITWSFKLFYATAKTLWSWKKISYNDVTTSRWKSNKKPMSSQYRTAISQGPLYGKIQILSRVMQVTNITHSKANIFQSSNLRGYGPYFTYLFVFFKVD